MLSEIKAPHYLLRMGSHAERFYFEWAKSLYDVLILNANLVQGTPSACLSLCEALDGKPYIIDPFNFAFALPPHYIESEKINRRTKEKTISLKRTFKELAVRYGEPFVTHLGVEALKPADFSNLVIAQAAVKNILEFQRDRLEEEQPQRGPLRISTSPIRPAALIAPYFYIDESMDWYDTDITLAKEAVNLNLGLPIYAVIAIDRTILQDVSKLTSIADGYCKTKVDGFFIWISDQIEYDLGSQDVCNYIKLIKALCADGRPVYNFYGGFLSAILSAFGLTGFSHGAGYGEHRNVIPVLGGGLPPAKFYIPSLHKGFVFAEAHTILSKVSSASDFYKYVCNCPVCQATIDDDFLANFEKYGETEVKGVDRRGQPVIGQTTDSIKACRAHYLVARFNELVNIRENDIRSVLLELDTALKQYHSPSGFPPISYLHVWENSVSDELDKLS